MEDKTVLDENARYVISIIEEIESHDREASILDYETSLDPENDNLKWQFKYHQKLSNDLTNMLKLQGIEIEWDGPGTRWVKKDSQTYIKRDMFNSGEWEYWTYQLPLQVQA